MEEKPNRCVSPAKRASFSLDSITLTPPPPVCTGAKAFLFPLATNFSKSEKTF